MLYYYYDINSKDDFEHLFKDTYIYKHQTNKRNSYYILKFDFSRLNSAETEKEMKTRFNLAVKDGLTRFSNYYELNLKINEKLGASDMLDDFINQLSFDYHLYILIDEYDNFTNSLLKEDDKTFKKILGKDGFVRDFYASLKFHMSDIVKKIFITGVCSITLDSMTSGFNIGTNITNEPDFNFMTALTHKEVRDLIKYLNIKGDIFKILEENYDGYKFNKNIKETAFNPNLVMYFLDYYMRYNEIPSQLLDSNIYSDYSQIYNIVHLFDRNIYQKAINEILENNKVIGDLKENFYLEGHSNDNNYIISLLYYFGYLTIKENVIGMDPLITFTVPNKVMRSVFNSYFVNILNDHNIIIETSKQAEFLDEMNKSGEINKLTEYVSSLIKLCDNRIFENFNEKDIVLMYYIVMSTNISFYKTYNEYQANGGYIDLFLLGNKKYTKYDFILEFKYIKKENYSENLLNKKIEEGQSQLIKYSSDPRINKNSKKYLIIYVGRDLKKVIQIL